MQEPSDRTIVVSGTVFVWACLVLVLVALGVAAGGVAFALSAAGRAESSSTALVEAKDGLLTCQRTLLVNQGRLTAFEDLLIRTQHSAVEASLKAFEREYGKPVDQAALAEYDAWLRRK